MTGAPAAAWATPVALAKGTECDVRLTGTSPNGAPQVVADTLFPGNEIQVVSVENAVGGNYRLAFKFGDSTAGQGAVTGAISTSASAGDLEAALANLPNIGSTGSVHHVAVGPFYFQHGVAFIGTRLAGEI